MSAPWMKFYPTDWRADPALRMCSISARGLWMEMLCLMHEATPRGSLRVNGRGVNERQLASLSGSSIDEVSQALAELEDAGVFSRDEEGIPFSRRMQRDDAKAARDKANGSKGGNPELTGDKGRVNPPEKGEDKAQKPEARVQKKEEREPARGSFIPEDWQPDQSGMRLAIEELGSREAADRELAKFRDYWAGRTGADGRKRDWPATWRNWCRNAIDRRPKANHSRDGPAKRNLTDAAIDINRWMNADAEPDLSRTQPALPSPDRW